MSHSRIVVTRAVTEDLADGTQLTLPVGTVWAIADEIIHEDPDGVEAYDVDVGPVTVSIPANHAARVRSLDDPKAAVQHVIDRLADIQMSTTNPEALALALRVLVSNAVSKVARSSAAAMFQHAVGEVCYELRQHPELRTALLAALTTASGEKHP